MLSSRVFYFPAKFLLIWIINFLYQNYTMTMYKSVSVKSTDKLIGKNRPFCRNFS